MRRVRTSTLPRLEASWDAHCDAVAIRKPLECVPNRRSRTARRSCRLERTYRSSAPRRRGTLPSYQRVKLSAARRRSEAGANTARRLTCFAPASLCDPTRAPFRAVQPLFCRLECCIIRMHPPNKRMQSDAATRRQDRGVFECRNRLDSFPVLLGRRG